MSPDRILFQLEGEVEQRTDWECSQPCLMVEHVAAYSLADGRRVGSATFEVYSITPTATGFIVIERIFLHLPHGTLVTGEVTVHASMSSRPPDDGDLGQTVFSISSSGEIFGTSGIYDGRSGLIRGSGHVHLALGAVPDLQIMNNLYVVEGLLRHDD